MLFFLFLGYVKIASQVIMRISDEKKLDKTIVSNKNNSVELNQKNLKHYIFTSEDKIVLDGVKYDFSFDDNFKKAVSRKN